MTETTGTYAPPIVKPAADASTEVKTWGAGKNVEQKDLIIPKIHHQQGLSKIVETGKAVAGDWCDSLTKEVLAKKDQPLNLIIFESYKRLLIYKLGLQDKNYQFQESLEYTPENSVLPWEEEQENGEVIRRNEQFNFFCLVEGRLLDLPYVISLSSTKTRAAKILTTFIGKLDRIGEPSAARIFELRSVKETKGEKSDKTWYNVDVSCGRETTPEELKAAKYWYEKMQSEKVVVADDAKEKKGAPISDTDDDIPF